MRLWWLLLAGCAPDPDGASLAIDVDGDGLTAELDCDDTDATVGGPVLRYRDADNDSFGGEAVVTCDSTMGVTVGGDCNDNNDAVSPSATETCNNIDDDCDGAVDWGATGQTEVWVDLDEDGFGDPTLGVLYTCQVEAGYATNNLDCDDNNTDVNPNADEVCGNGIDDNCDPLDCPDPGEVDLPDIDGALYEGEAFDDRLGAAVAHVGDLNRDGHADLAMGAPGGGPTSLGLVYIVYGPIGASGSAAAVTGGVVFGGFTNGIGTSFAGIGDIDEDGFDDLLVGSPTDLFASGQAYIVRGPILGTVSTADSDWSTSGLAESELGFHVARIGDLNHDGRDDFAIGAPGTLDDAGVIYIHTQLLERGRSDLGAGDRQLTGAPGDRVGGGPIIDAGDLDGDGETDLLVAAPGNNRVYAVLSASFDDEGTLLETATSIVVPSSTAGTTIAIDRLPDVDGDGIDEFVFGAPSWQGFGGVFILYSDRPWQDNVVLSTAAQVSIRGGVLGDRFGAYVATGDVNGDGVGDIIASGPGARDGSGAALVFNGPISPGAYSVGTTITPSTLVWGPDGAGVGPVAYIPSGRGGHVAIGAPFLPNAGSAVSGGVGVVFGNTVQ